MLRCSALLPGSTRSLVCSQIAGAHKKVTEPRLNKLSGGTLRWNYAHEVNVGKLVYSKDAPPGAYMKIWVSTALLIGCGVVFFILAKNDLIKKRRERMVQRRNQQDAQFRAGFQMNKESKIKPSSSESV